MLNNIIKIIMVILIICVCYIGYILYQNQIKNIKIYDELNLPIVKKSDNIQIPKIIIQTWKTNDIPTKYLDLVNSIKTHNPDYKYMFFSDIDIENFLKHNYPKYYETYLKLPIIIQKIDFFRYVAIYHYGGFYMDLDIECSKSFNPLLKYSCIFPIDDVITNKMCGLTRYKNFCKNKQKFLLGQYAFASVPKHPFIKNLIETINLNVDNYIKYLLPNNNDYVYKTTGPDFVTNLYVDYQDKTDILILNNNKRQYFGDFAQHKYFGSWK